MKCHKCGAEIASGELICGECGAHVEESADPAALFCERCGTKNDSGDRFCMSCGAPLTAKTPESATEHVSEPEPGSDQEPVLYSAPSAVQTSSPKNILPIAIASVCAVAIAASLIAFFVFRKSSPTDYEYVPYNGVMITIATTDRDLKARGLMSAPTSASDTLMSVPAGFVMKADGRAFDIDGGKDLWFRVVDHGGYVLGWAESRRCIYSEDGFEPGTRPDELEHDRAKYARSTRKGTTLRERKHDPASYTDVRPASGWVAVPGDIITDVRQLPVWPAPGHVDDVAFTIPSMRKVRIDGWAKDAFDKNSTNRWLRVKDKSGRVIGWIDSADDSCDASDIVYDDTPQPQAASRPLSQTQTQTQRSERDDPFANNAQSDAHEDAEHDPASYRYVPCSGYVQADTKDGSLLNVRPAPGVIDPIVFQVPDSSKMRVDGWAWDEVRGNSTYWLRVVDHGGFVLGWVSYEFCSLSNVDFRGTRPFASNWTKTSTRSGSSVQRKHDPSAYDANFATGHITVTAQGHDLNVRPAPGVVDDVVFIITDKNGCKVNGWSYDQFERGTDRIWLRLTDNRDSILGWVDAAYCDTKHVELH